MLPCDKYFKTGKNLEVVMMENEKRKREIGLKTGNYPYFVSLMTAKNVSIKRGRISKKKLNDFYWP